MLEYNIQILPDALLGENPYLVQSRSHRKKRINKKWAKRFGRWIETPSFVRESLEVKSENYN